MVIFETFKYNIILFWKNGPLYIYQGTLSVSHDALRAPCVSCLQDTMWLGVFCVACGTEETTLHPFWSCQHSAQFWQLLLSEKRVLVATPPSLMDSQSALACWLLGLFARASDEERATMVQATYGLLLARNEVRNGRKIAATWNNSHSKSSYGGVESCPGWEKAPASVKWQCQNSVTRARRCCSYRSQWCV